MLLREIYVRYRKRGLKDFRKKKSRILSLFVLISLNSYFHLEIMEKVEMCD